VTTTLAPHVILVLISTLKIYIEAMLGYLVAYVIALLKVMLMNLNNPRIVNVLWMFLKTCNFQKILNTKVSKCENFFNV
jgi:hypothetical protein